MNEEGMKSTKDRKGWIGVDLDGTLAEYVGWDGTNAIGNAIPRMMVRVKEWVRLRYEVKIFTARVSPEADTSKTARYYIQNWLIRNGLPVLEIVCCKDHRMIELWDDRCVQVETNTGRTRREGWE